MYVYKCERKKYRNQNLIQLKSSGKPSNTLKRLVTQTGVLGVINDLHEIP